MTEPNFKKMATDFLTTNGPSLPLRVISTLANLLQQTYQKGYEEAIKTTRRGPQPGRHFWADGGGS